MGFFRKYLDAFYLIFVVIPGWLTVAVGLWYHPVMILGMLWFALIFGGILVHAHLTRDD